MKLTKILLITILIYTGIGISRIDASSIDPAIRTVTLSQGERQYGSVVYKNSENRDIEILLTPYTYNPKTDDITEEKRNIFLKVDTDTIKVKGHSSYNIKYEIYPLSNLPHGTYYNILAITPVNSDPNVKINPSISQLIILNIVDPNDLVKGITTSKYDIQLGVKHKGIPFIKPTVISYEIKNNSNFMLIPQGRLDIYNEKNSYKPTYIYINTEKEKIYPGETLEREIEIPNWYISDIFLRRIISGEIYNGVDRTPKKVEIASNHYLLELGILLVVIILTITFTKSVKEDIEKTKKESV